MLRHLAGFALFVGMWCGSLHAQGHLSPLFETDTFDLRTPNYFITGFGSAHADNESSVFTDPNNQVKFQININFRLAEMRSTRLGLYFGYTQLSFWNLYDQSAPFLDNNYKPELFLHFDPSALREGMRYAPTLKLSVAHESNGLAGEDNRGWDRLIATAELGQPSQSPIFAEISLWQVLSRTARDQNYTTYIGDGSIGLHWRLPMVGKALRLGFSAVTHVKFAAPLFTSLELNAFANPFIGIQSNIRWLPSFMVQYYVGTGENLLNYRERTTSLRIGLAFVR